MIKGFFVVGATRFERATPTPPVWCATILRHAPPYVIFLYPLIIIALKTICCQYAFAISHVILILKYICNKPRNYDKIALVMRNGYSLRTTKSNARG